MSSVDLSLSDFEQTVTQEGITLVDFWAEWCGPCRQFAPVFEKAAEANPDITFAKVDTDAEQQLSQMAGIASIPTLMLFRDGILLFNQAGAMPPQALGDLIRQAREVDMDAVREQAAQQQANPDEVDLDTFVAEHANGAYVLDVRTDEEYAEGRVPGAVHLPMDQVGARLAEVPTDRPVYVVCRSGGRSRSVMQFLRDQGVDAINVDGGTKGWAQRGWPLES